MELRYVGRRSERASDTFDFDGPAKKNSKQIGDLEWIDSKPQTSLKKVVTIGISFAFCVFLFVFFWNAVFGSSSGLVSKSESFNSDSALSRHGTSIGDFVPVSSKSTSSNSRRTKRMRTSKKFFTWSDETAAEIHSHKLSDIVFIFHEKLTDDQTSEKGRLNTALVSSFADIAEEQSDLVKDGEFKKEMLFITVSEEYLSSFRPLLNDKVITQLPFGLVVELENNYRKFLLPHDDIVNVAKNTKFDAAESTDAADVNEIIALAHYKMTKDALSDYVKGQVRFYMKGELPVWMRSSSDEEHDGSSVWFITGDEFNKLVMETTEDVLVMFTSSFCPQSSKVLPNFIELADKYVDVESMLFFKFDVTKHDVPHDDVQIFATPHFRFFKSGEKHIARAFDPPVVPGNTFVDWGSEYLMKNIGFPIDEENTARRRQRRLEREARKAQRDRAKQNASTEATPSDRI